MTDEQTGKTADDVDLAAQDAVLSALLPSIHIAAAAVKKTFSALQIETDDLVQEALIGSLRAIHSFQSDKGCMFSTYALSAAHNAMLDYVRKCRADLPESGPALSLDAPLPGIDFPSETYADILLNEYALSPEQIFIKRETIKEVRKALSMISERERTYLHYRYGFVDDTEHDRKETAHHFHLSVSRAKSLERSALENCKKHLT